MAEMRGILKSEEKVLGDMTLTVRVLNVEDARKVYVRIQRMLGLWASEDVEEIGATTLAGMMGGIQEEDLKVLTEIFGKCTQITFPGDPSRTVPAISSAGSRAGLDEAFAGRFDLLLEWLDFCVTVNFRDLIEKLRGVERAKRVEAPKAEPKE